MKKEKNIKNRFRRPLGILERYHSTMNYLGFDTCVIVTAKYVVQSERQRLDKDILFPALCRYLDREPALSFRIINERSKKPEFVRLNSIDLNKAVRFHADSPDSSGTPDFLTQFMQEEFSKPFDTSSELPLWRITVLYDNTIVFSWNHTIGDGTSGVAFHRGVLDALNASSTIDTLQKPFSPIWNLQIDTAPSLIPPVEKLTDLSVKYKTLFKEANMILRPEAWKRSRISVWTGNDVPSQPPHNPLNHNIILPLKPDTVLSLLSQCRSHKASLTGALYAIGIACLSPLIDTDSKQLRYTKIATEVPVSLRSFTNTPITALCDQVTTFPFDADLLSDFSWEFASEYTQKLHDSRERTKEITGSLKYLFGHYESYFLSKLGHKRERGLLISNLGSFNFNASSSEKVLVSASESAPWRIQEMYFSQFGGVQGAALKMNVVGDPEGGISICFTWADGALDDGFMQVFVSGYRKILETLSDIYV